MKHAPLNPNLTRAIASPIMEAGSWLEAHPPPPDRKLIDLRQAVPAGPPSDEVRRAMAEAALNDPDAHLYGAVLGRDALREGVAKAWGDIYQGAIAASQVGVTAGCNQAFCAAILSLAAPGDEVILPTPWYFNHKMWLDMAGMKAVPLPTNQDNLPDVASAEALITDRTRAIAVVSPNNPTGVEYPPGLLDDLLALAAEKGIALIVDETYRDYHSADGPPHDLFRQANWPDNFIHLYSFSKIMRLTGHRIGAVIAHEDRIAEIEKFLDTMTICPSQIGQIGAITGLETLTETRARERAVFDSRRAALQAEFVRGVGDWRLVSSGAYFAYAEHPFDMDSREVCKRLVADQSILILPGVFFGPTRAEGGDGTAEKTCRIAFANVDEAGIAEMADRMRRFRG